MSEPVLRITVELLPGGDASKAQPLVGGEVRLVSMNEFGTYANYRIDLRDKAGKLWKQGQLLHFPRKRLVAWDLVQWGLNRAIGEER